MYTNKPGEQSMNNAAITRAERVSFADAANRTIEGPFRRFAWYLRTSGVIERTSVRILAAALFVAALGSIVWLATSLIVAL
jgi:hypothetical protein